MTSPRLLLLCLTAHAFVPSPPTRRPRRRRATRTHAIRNWWSGASSDRDWRAALREACAGVAAVLGEADDDDAVLALCFASRGHAQSIGSIGEAFDEEVGARATSARTAPRTNRGRRTIRKRRPRSRSSSACCRRAAPLRRQVSRRTRRRLRRKRRSAGKSSWARRRGHCLLYTSPSPRDA